MNEAFSRSVITILLVLMLMLCIPTATADVYDEQLGGGYNDLGVDDGFENGLDSVSYTQDQVQVNKQTDDTANNYNTGFTRWATVGIPRYSTINSGTVYVYIYNATYDDADFTVYGHKHGNSGGLHSGAGDPIGDYEIRDRIKTGTSAAWVQDGVAAVTAGTKTLSITNILQELVNMGTWSSVSAVSLMWVPNGTGTAKQFWFRDWNWDGPGGSETLGYQAPTLRINYTAYSGTNPGIATLAPTLVTGTTALGNGNIGNVGSPTATAHGMAYGTSANPTISGSSTDEGTAELGLFTSVISGLTPSTQYYIRAYATNVKGTVYGDQEIFTTSGAATASPPVGWYYPIRYAASGTNSYVRMFFPSSAAVSYRYPINYAFTAGSSAGASYVDISASGTEILYNGRINFTDQEAPIFYWPGTSLRTKFEGTSIQVRMSDSEGNNYYHWVVDSASGTFECSQGLTTYPIVTGLAAGTHTFEIHKRTDTVRGNTTFNGFILDAGSELINPGTRPGKRIEFYGDSITTGMGLHSHEGAPSGCGGTEGDNACEDNYNTYGAQTARALGAEYRCISRSSGSLYRLGWSAVNLWSPDGADEGTGLFGSSDGFNWGDWDHNDWVPQVVVVNVLQNDYPSRRVQHTVQEQYDYYEDFLWDIRNTYGEDTYIFCVLGDMWAIDPASTTHVGQGCGANNPDCMYGDGAGSGIIENAVSQFITNGGTRVYAKLFEWDSDGLGVGSRHPSWERHTTMAAALSGSISAIVPGW